MQINTCSGTTEIWSPYTLILSDCFQLALSIGNKVFQHCPREAIKTANNLAIFFDSNFNFSRDGDPAPTSVLRDILLDDVTLLGEE